MTDLERDHYDEVLYLNYAYPYTHPDAEVVGIESSSVQIERGRARAGRLGLTNLRLEVADLLELDPADMAASIT